MKKSYLLQKFPYSFTKIHADVSPLIKKASEMAKKAFLRGATISQKGGTQMSTDILTQTDLDIDQMLREALKKKFPEFGLVTEEHVSKKPKEAYCWVIDPIDGTANFAHDIPIFGISVGLWGPQGPLYGIISLPMQGSKGEIVHALTGGGVFLNDKPFTRKRKTQSKHLEVLINQVATKEEKLAVHEEINKLLPFPYNYRCATYHLAMTALGRFDCVVAAKLALWDFAAGILIAQEAGLSCEFWTPFPKLTDDSVREYTHGFVIAEEHLAKKVALKLK